MKHSILIVEGDRFGEWIDCESDEQLTAERNKLDSAGIDYVVDPNW